MTLKKRLVAAGMVAWMLGVFVSASPAASYTPEHPVVQDMVNRGVGYLESLQKDDFIGRITDFSGGGGERVLIAYAHHKCRHDPTNPVVRQGLGAAQAITDALNAGKGTHGHKKVYEIAICVLLFAEVDPDVYRRQLVDLQKHLFESQHESGAWGYPGDNNGDTSQTQYALLAVWTLDRVGIPLEYERVASALQWLFRVQDPSGGWPYHGKDPGPGRGLVRQTRVDMSMSLAGGSSLLIGGDALRVWGETVDDDDPGIVGLPKAIKLYKEDKNARRRKQAAVSEEPIYRSLGAMERWRTANPYKRSNVLDWYYYQLYTIERYQSFLEIASGSIKDKSPAWYNQGVEELRKYQGPDGGWTDRTHSRPPASTAFALLFLIRSTQKAVFNISSGVLAGGRELPTNTTEIRVEGTQIKGAPIATDITNMLDILEKDGADDLGDKSLPDNLLLDKDPTGRAAQLDRLERLVRGSQSWQARRVAARVLATSDELRVVPSLIFALSDKDPKVWRFARDGLRFISRRFDGMGLGDPPPGENVPDYSEVLKAQQKWRAWYKTMNPKYVFLDYDL
ncbi:MAG: hypothetical protein MI861_10875 [Pirellulales bacterium]|nr:hypothetical protein [Pirellulales bacterium]